MVPDVVSNDAGNDADVRIRFALVTEPEGSCLRTTNPSPNAAFNASASVSIVEKCPLF
jgi:hypothetical protein